jgi:hypothetical protein
MIRGPEYALLLQTIMMENVERENGESIAEELVNLMQRPRILYSMQQLTDTPMRK